MASTKRCSCVVKLEQLHATVREELHPCKEQLYETRLSQLQGEIDTLLLRNDDLRGQLADVNSVIANDPFLSSKFQGIGARSTECVSQVYGIELNPSAKNADIYRQLCILADRNRELESRLSAEKAVSMSWKHKIHDLEKKLDSQLDELVDLTKDVTCVRDRDYARIRSEKRDGLTKEAVHLLKLARLRIDSDKTRIDSLTNRISELERQLLDYRLNSADAANHVNVTTVKPATSPIHASYQQPYKSTYQDPVSYERDLMVQSLDISRDVLHNDPSKYYGGHTPIANKGISPSSHDQTPAQAQESSERKQLIALYSDILQLIKKNREPVAKPLELITEAKVSKAPKVKESKKEIRQAEKHKERSSGKKASSKRDVHVVEHSDDKSGRLPQSGSSSNEPVVVPSSKGRSTLTQQQSKAEKHVPIAKREDDHLSNVSSEDKGGMLRHGDTLDRGSSYASIRSEPTDNVIERQATDVSSKRIGSSESVAEVLNEESSDDQGVGSEENAPLDSVREDSESARSSATEAVSPPLSIRDGSDSDTISSNSCVESSVVSPHNDPLETPRESVGLGGPPTGALHDDNNSSVGSGPSSVISDDRSSVVQGQVDSSPSDVHVESVEPTVVEDDGASKTLDHSSSDEHESDSSASSDDSFSKDNSCDRPTPVEAADKDVPPPPMANAGQSSTTTELISRGSTASLDYTSEKLERDTPSRDNLVVQMSEQKLQMLNDLLLLLESVPILKDLPKKRLSDLLRYFKLQSYRPNAAIILAGEKPQNFYVLASGMVSAYSYESFDKPNRLLRRYLNADYFGEMSLMNNTQCSSYVIADGHVTVQAMSGKHFVEQLSDLFPKFRQRAKEEYSLKDTQSHSDPSMPERAIDAFDDLMDFMGNVPMVSMISNLDVVVSKLSYKEFTNKEVVVGSIKSLRDFCIVYRGTLEVHLNDPAFSKFSDFAILGPTSFVGCFKYTNPQVVEIMESASLVATGSVVLLKLDRHTFNHHMSNIADDLREFSEQFFLDKMQEHELLKGMEDLSARLSEGTNHDAVVSEELASSSLPSDDGGFTSSDDDLDTDRGTQPDGRNVDRDDDSDSSHSTDDDDHSKSQKRSTASSAGRMVERGEHKDVPQLASSDIDEGRKGGFGRSMSSSRSSSFGDSSEGDDVSSAPLSNENLDSFRSEITEEIVNSDASVSPPSDRAATPHARFEEDTTSAEKEKNMTFTGRRVRRVQTGIFPKGTKFVHDGNISDDNATRHLDSNISRVDNARALHTDDEDGSFSSNADDHLLESEDDVHHLDTSLESADCYSDDTSSATPVVYDEKAVRASKDLFIATLKSKCSSLASAFNVMDSDNCGLVFPARFYDAVEDLCIASIETNELPHLFNSLKEPDRDVVTMASLYRNSGEHLKNATELCLRLKHVYGSALVAFEKQFGVLKKSSTCTEADFAIMLNHVGVSEEEAKEIFKELDVCGNGYVTVMTMLKLMRGDWTREVAIEKESASVSGYNQILGYLQQEDYQEFRKEFSNPYRCVYDLLEYGTDVSAVDSSWEEMKTPGKTSKGMKRYIDTVVAPALEAHEHFKLLSVVQRKFLSTLFTDTKHTAGSVVISEGQEDYPLYLLLSGSVKSSYSTYLYSESGLTDVAEGCWLAFDTFVQDQPSAYTYKVGEDSTAVLCSIGRETFKDTIVPMLETRAKRVPVFSLFLSKVPCFEKVDPADIERIARACVVRKYKMHETIFKANEPLTWMYIVFDGCVILKVPGVPDQTSVSVETTGMLGADDVSNKLTHYQTTAIANTAVVLLIGWPVSVFDDVFGAAAESVFEASQLDSIARDNTLQRLQTEYLTSQPKTKKSVSFSINKEKKSRR